MARAAAFCAGVGAATAFGVGAHEMVLATRPADAVATLHVSGDVAGVVPGGPSVPLTVTLRNTGNAPARMSTVTTTSTGTSGPRSCAAGYLSVGTWHGALTVPVGGAARITVPVRLAAATPSECASVAWRLAYWAQ